MNDSFSIYRYIIDKCSIVDVIKNYINLQKKGNNYWGLCPFHGDNNPSLSVNESKKIFKCFVCNAKGNAINFVAKYKKISDFNAIKEIATTFNLSDINLNNYFKNYSDINEKWEKIYKLNSQACFIYHKSLLADKYEKQLNYLLDRNLTIDLIKEYEIGYAPNEDNSKYLFSRLTNENNMFGANRDENFIWTPNQLVENSLAILKDDGTYSDFFWDRIIIPIKDEHNNIVGFSGRILNQSGNIKYLNTKTTDVFKKENLLFNFNNFDKTQFNEIFLVEGYMDVFAFRQINIENVIASMGTAFTNHQINLIKKYPNIKSIILCFDNDNAGYNATMEFVKKIKNWNINIFIVKPYDKNFKDIDEYLKANGKEKTRNIVSNHISVVEFQIEKKFSETTTDKEKKVYANEIIANINEIGFNELFIDSDLQKLSNASGISVENLKTLINKKSNENLIYQNKQNNYYKKQKNNNYFFNSIDDINIYGFPKISQSKPLDPNFYLNRLVKKELDLIQLICNNNYLCKIYFDTIGDIYFVDKNDMWFFKSLFYYLRLCMENDIKVSYKVLIKLINLYEENPVIKEQLIELINHYQEKVASSLANEINNLQKMEGYINEDSLLQKENIRGLTLMKDLLYGIESIKFKEIALSNKDDISEQIKKISKEIEIKLDKINKEINPND
ncbi:DNA primase [Malacoplasma iowae]|uniref:DNA primase n=1 Tax=Malacoplasma iowae 695 TaxID=1048830 RepID=A0A6P1LMF0_MALIO|nr:DNA primase [Malacoplasma iowae]QHG89692.1 DNA primase [Malacoplasma iowae 695]WPL35517.1 DNA primase [Malacoplasma iowae]VEU62648.1 DNA primase [Mycoplasmopsis fermentans]VEU72193.1 DNA primase [Malacoplasma iowae]